jgi:surfeit locus 1 family protein
MRRSALVLALALLVLAAVCVRLGVWQMSRWQEKRALEGARRAMLAAPPLDLDDPLAAPIAHVAGRVVRVRGAWDTTRIVLLTGRTHDGVPGIEWVRPLRVPGGELMVVRGWSPAEDGVHPRSADRVEDGVVTLRGIAEPMRRGAGDFAPAPLAGTPGTFTARWLDADSLAHVMSLPLAGWSLRVLPGDAAPAGPIPLIPVPIDARVHLSYAIQWFVFALAALFAAGVVLRRRAPRPVTTP